MLFYLYLIYIISFFSHLPARIPILGTIRFEVILGLLIIVLLLINKKKSGDNQSLRNDNTGKILNIFIIYILLTLPFVEWPGSVIFTNSINYIKIIVFYYFTRSIIDTERRFIIFIITFMAVQSFRIFEPLYLHITSGYWGSFASMANWEFMNRLSGSPYDWVNPNGLAFVITSVIPFYHYLCLKSSHRWKILYFIVMPTFLYALYLTGSRTGFLAFLLIIVGLFFKSEKKLLFVAATILVLIFTSYMGMDQSHRERYLSIISSNTSQSGSAQGRITGLIADIKVGLNRPIFGHGLGTSPEANANERGIPQRSHNLYAELFQEVGIIGLVIFIFFIVAIYSNIVLSLREVKTGSGKVKINFINSIHAIQVWLWMNILFSFASYGLSSYEWYLFAGLSSSMTNILSIRNKQ